MRVWIIRPDRIQGFAPTERNTAKWAALQREWSKAEFQVVHAPSGLSGLRGRADVGLICTSHVGEEVHHRGIDKRIGFRVYFPEWQRGPRCLARQMEHIRRINYQVIMPDEGINVPEFRAIHKRVHWVDQAFDPEKFYPPAPDDPRVRDVGFVGNAQAFGRIDLLRRMREALPGHRVDWDQGLSHTRLGRYLRSCKIGWNQIQTPEGRLGSNYRLYEVTGTAAFHLGNWTAQCEQQGYKDGEHLVYWHNEKDLMDKAGYYLDHDGERERIARQGYELAISRHTWAHRAREMMTVIKRYA